MPKLEIPIGGYSQSVDERKNPPRITRLMNCRVDGGALKMTPGNVSVPSTLATPGTALGLPISMGKLASGASFMLSKQAENIGGAWAPEDTGLRLLVSEETPTTTRWLIPGQHLDPDQSIRFAHLEYDECPILTSVFNDPNVHFESPGVLDLGSDGFVVVAEGLYEYNEGTGAFSYSLIHWAFFAPGQLTPVASGSTNGIGVAGTRAYVSCAGKCIAYYNAANSITVREFSTTQRCFFGSAGVTTTATAGAQTNIDLSYDSYTGRYLLVDSLGYGWLINASSWTVVNSITFTPAGMVQGTLGVAIASNASYTGRVYLCYRVANNWMAECWQVTDSAESLTAGPWVVYTTPTALSEPAGVRWQAGVTAIEGASVSGSGSANVAACAVWKAPASPAPGGIGVVTFVTPSGVATDHWPIHMFGASPAARPVLHDLGIHTATNTKVWASIWALHCGHQSTIRGAMRLKASQLTFPDSGSPHDSVSYYPRLAAHVSRGGAVPPVPGNMYLGHLNQTVAVSCLGPKENSQYRKGWVTAIMRQRNAFTRMCDVLLISQVDGTTHYTWPCNVPDSLQSASGNGVTVFASSMPYQAAIDLEPSGSQYVPRAPGAVPGGSGTTPASGSYNYCTVREWKDRSGAVHRSAPSDVKSISSGGGSIDLSIYDDPWTTEHIGATTKIYRTKASGVIFYLLAELPNVGTTDGTVAYADTTADSFLSAREILYTQADRGGISGLLGWWGAPGCRCIWAGADRFIAGGLDNTNRVRWSNLFYPGEGTSWPEDEAFFCDLPEPIVAVGYLGGTWLAWSSRALYAITGQGPDAFGQGAFDTPRKVHDVGAHSWRSLVETPLGIFFQGEDKQVYLASPGQYGSVQVQMVSGEIRNSIGQAPEDHSGLSSVARARRIDRYEYTGNWIRSAVYDADLREVWFGEFVDRAWVYSLDSGAWRSEVDYQHSAGHYLLSGGITKAKALSVQGAGYVDFWKPAFVRTNYFSSLGTLEAYRVRSSSEVNAYVDAAGNWRYMGFWTSDIDLDHGRVKRIWINQDREELFLEATPYTVRADLHLWYDGYRGELDPEDTMSVSHDATAANVNRFLSSEFCPARQKCNEFRFAYIVNPQTHPNLSWHITGIVLDVESTGLKQQRIPSVGRGA